MNRFSFIVFAATVFILLTSCSTKERAVDRTFFEVSPSIKIQTKDGISLKEGSMILEMYRILSIGRVTIFYSKLADEGKNWEAKKKGHWGYKTMNKPIQINKRNGYLKHGGASYSLKDLVKQYKENEGNYQKKLQEHKTQ